MVKKKPKLGVVVPYRCRERQIKEFITYITRHLNRQQIPFEIIIVEQDNSKQFNRGLLLNIGFAQARKLNCKYVVFHDVDILPIYADYGYSDMPVHLATSFNDPGKEIFDEYFGGVTIFPLYDFELINGYSNKYWGWGFEDTDLLFRCKIYEIDLDTLKIENIGIPQKALRFNGIDTYVKGRNVFDLDSNLTFFVSFYPDDILCDHTKDMDNYTIFSIPGYDTSISYNSFSRYNFCTFDEDKNALYINSKIKTNYKTNICITFDNDNKKIRAFQDGIFIGEVEIKKNFLSYSYERFFFLGAGNPDRYGDERFFKGYFTTFAVVSEVLKDSEIKMISEIDNFNSIPSYNLLIHYDAKYIDRYKLVDLSGNGYDGTIVKCEIVDLEFEKYKNVLIPHKRESLFKVLPHEENGFVDNKWKDKATRWNQLRFHNEVFINPKLIKHDGLSTLEFVEHGLVVKDNITRINVGL